MEPNLLVLGGTTEATALCQKLAERGLCATVSLAGRVARPADQAVPARVGGFGGTEGLADYLRTHQITHLIDATHPFAVQISRNAVVASAQTNVPLIALTRSVWTAGPGDIWTHVPDMAGAVQALDCSPLRVMLAVGRMHLSDFVCQPQHFYLLRLVDPPQGALPFPECHAVIDRGPFSVSGDLKLLQAHQIDLIVSKNSGGSGAQAKILAARQLGLPVIMIDRPTIPPRPEVHHVDHVLQWLDHGATDLGV